MGTSRERVRTLSWDGSALCWHRRHVPIGVMNTQKCEQPQNSEFNKREIPSPGSTIELLLFILHPCKEKRLVTMCTELTIETSVNKLYIYCYMCTCAWRVCVLCARAASRGQKHIYSFFPHRWMICLISANVALKNAFGRHTNIYEKRTEDKLLFSILSRARESAW